MVPTCRCQQFLQISKVFHKIQKHDGHHVVFLIFYQHVLYIYQMTLPCFAVAQCGCKDEEYQCSRKLRFRHYYQRLFLQVALYIHPLLRVLEVNINIIRRISIHITESKIHISYLKNHDSTLILSSIISTCHPFQPSSIRC